MSDLPLKKQLLVLCSQYCKERDISRSRLSTLIFNGGHVIDRIAANSGDLTTRSFERAMQWLSDNWPDDLAWPDDIQRPAPGKDAA